MDSDALNRGTNPILIGEIEPGSELAELVPYMTPSPAEVARAADADDPEFDAYMAVVRLLIGGTIEGAVELARRLEMWEAELNAAEGEPEPGEIHRAGDVTRYMLVGMALSAGDGVRRQSVKLVQASDVLLRFSGSMAQPLIDNRLTGIIGRPLDRAFNRLVDRGQQSVNRWVELGRNQEPGARRLARKTYVELVDEFIGHLAENEELAELVQEQSVSLAAEAVDEFRSRTVSADEIAEKIVRRILRRPPRSELPPPPDIITQAIADEKKPSRRSQP